MCFKKKRAFIVCEKCHHAYKDARNCPIHTHTPFKHCKDCGQINEGEYHCYHVSRGWWAFFFG